MFSTRPRMGTCIIWAIWTALPTIMPTSSCGLDTMTMPSTGSVWNTVSGTSPVPGACQRTKSTSHDLLPELLDAPAMTGPRQTTGASGSSRQQVDAHDFHAGTAGNQVDALAVTGGRALHAEQAGMDGPVMSASSTPALKPRRHRDSQHGAGHAFDAALAGNDADDFWIRLLACGGSYAAARGDRSWTCSCCNRWVQASLMVYLLL